MCCCPGGLPRCDRQQWGSFIAPLSINIKFIKNFGDLDDPILHEGRWHPSVTEFFRARLGRWIVLIRATSGTPYSFKVRERVGFVEAKTEVDRCSLDGGST